MSARYRLRMTCCAICGCELWVQRIKTQGNHCAACAAKRERAKQRAWHRKQAAKKAAEKAAAEKAALAMDAEAERRAEINARTMPGPLAAPQPKKQGRPADFAPRDTYNSPGSEYAVSVVAAVRAQLAGERERGNPRGRTIPHLVKRDTGSWPWMEGEL